MHQQTAPRKQAVYPDGDAKRTFEHGATLQEWQDDYAVSLLARYFHAETVGKSLGEAS